MATGGTLALVVAAAALAGGVGSLLGAILAKWVGDSHANYLQEQLDLAACSYGCEPGMPRRKGVLSTYFPKTPVETCTFTHCRYPVEH